MKKEQEEGPEGWDPKEIKRGSNREGPVAEPVDVLRDHSSSGTGDGVREASRAVLPRRGG